MPNSHSASCTRQGRAAWGGPASVQAALPVSCCLHHRQAPPAAQAERLREYSTPATHLIRHFQNVGLLDVLQHRCLGRRLVIPEHGAPVHVNHHRGAAALREWASGARGRREGKAWVAAIECKRSCSAARPQEQHAPRAPPPPPRAWRRRWGLPPAQACPSQARQPPAAVAPQGGAGLYRACCRHAGCLRQHQQEALAAPGAPCLCGTCPPARPAPGCRATP